MCDNDVRQPEADRMGSHDKARYFSPLWQPAKTRPETHLFRESECGQHLGRFLSHGQSVNGMATCDNQRRETMKPPKEKLRSVVSDSRAQTLEAKLAHEKEVCTAVTKAKVEAEDQVARLREALKPFAEAADIFQSEYPDIQPDNSCGIKFSALRMARAALADDEV